MSQISPEVRDENNSNLCPICHEEGKRLIHSKVTCRHGFCEDCLVLLLFRPGPARDVTSLLNVCPMCRQDLHLIDMVFQDQPEQPAFQVLEKHVPEEIEGATYKEVEDDLYLKSLYFSQEKCSMQAPLTGMECEIQPIYYHPKTHTWHGSVKFDESDAIYDRWLVWLTFDCSFRHIQRGLLRKYRRKSNEPFLFQGEWKSLFLGDTIDETNTTVIHVSDTQLVMAGEAEYVLLTETTDDILTLRLFRVNTLVVTGQATPSFEAQLEKGSDNIPTGGEILWNWCDTSTSAESPRQWKWTRKTIGSHDQSHELYHIGGESGHTFRRVFAQEHLIPQYNYDSLWGNVFCQAFMVGLASYHFVDENQCYISYEHQRTSAWPALDDGSPIPSRVYFHNVSFRDNTFRGEIRWQEDYGCTWVRRYGCSFVRCTFSFALTQSFLHSNKIKNGFMKWFLTLSSAA